MMTMASCQTQSMGSAKPFSAAVLSEEYERSAAEVRRKHDGQEIVVTGYVATSAAMPKPDEDQGSVFLTEKVHPPERPVTCWFTRDQAIEFSQIKGGQYLTVKGVFSGEVGVELRFCKLIKSE